MRDQSILRVKIGMCGLATTLLMAVFAGGVRAQAAPEVYDAGDTRWVTGKLGKEFAVRAFADDSAAGEEDSPLFIARCTPGKPGVAVWYYIEKPVVPGQPVGKDEMRGRFRPRAASLVVDGTDFPLEAAQVTPEENYGGNELTANVALDAPLLTAIRGGSAMTARIGGMVMSRVRLHGSARAIDALRRACQQP